MYEQCDIISIHTPLTKEGEHKTYHLADRRFFENLRRTPFFINAARGGVNDTEALKSAVEKGQIRAAIVDCWEGEPVIDAELLELTEIPTPHIAGFSYDGKANGTRMVIDAVKEFFNIDLPEHPIALPAPKSPVIDLSSLPRERRMEYAVLHTLDTERVARALKLSPQAFEALRVQYENPREFSAYTVLGAAAEERSLLQALGFNLK